MSQNFTFIWRCDRCGAEAQRKTQNHRPEGWVHCYIHSFRDLSPTEPSPDYCNSCAPEFLAMRNDFERRVHAWQQERAGGES